MLSSTFLVPCGTKSLQFLSCAIKLRMLVPENFSRSFSITEITLISRFSNKVLVNSSFVKTTSYFGAILSISKVHFSWSPTSGMSKILIRVIIESSIDKSCSLSLPEMGQSTQSSDSSITLWRLQKNQVLAYFTYDGNDAEANLSSRFDAPAYYTDQSDTWAMIRVSGPRSRDVLERICPIDLSSNVFTLGSVSRTVMEHIGTIIFRDEDDSFVLLTMRSFANSMLHAIEVSVKNVL